MRSQTKQGGDGRDPKLMEVGEEGASGQSAAVREGREDGHNVVGFRQGRCGKGEGMVHMGGQGMVGVDMERRRLSGGLDPPSPPSSSRQKYHIGESGVGESEPERARVRARESGWEPNGESEVRGCPPRGLSVSQLISLALQV